MVAEQGGWNVVRVYPGIASARGRQRSRWATVFLVRGEDGCGTREWWAGGGGVFGGNGVGHCRRRL